MSSLRGFQLLGHATPDIAGATTRLRLIVRHARRAYRATHKDYY
jgi:hypothetical protein